MMYDSNYLCTSIPPKLTKLIVQNTGAFYLQPRSVSVITVQAPMELKPQQIYDLNTSNDLLDGLILLAIHHKTNHKYHKLLNTSVLNASYNRV